MFILEAIMTVLDAVRGLFHEIAEFAFKLLCLAAAGYVVWLVLRPFAWASQRVEATEWWRRRFGYKHSVAEFVGIALAAIVIGGPILAGAALYALGILPVR